MCEFNNHFRVEEDRNEGELLILSTKKHVKNLCLKNIY